MWCRTWTLYAVRWRVSNHLNHCDCVSESHQNGNKRNANNPQNKAWAGFHNLRATTWQRGEDAGKLFPRVQPVNYSLCLIQRPSPTPTPCLSPPTTSFSNLTFSLRRFQENYPFWGADCGTWRLSLFIKRKTLTRPLSIRKHRVSVRGWNVRRKYGRCQSHLHISSQESAATFWKAFILLLTSGRRFSE